MPTIIHLDELPPGVARGPGRAGDRVDRPALFGAVSTDDGDAFQQQLDLVSDLWLSHLADAPRAETIDHLVIVFHRDRRAQVFVNETHMEVLMSPKAEFGPVGDTVMGDDVADVENVRLVGVDVQADAGVLVMFTANARRGIAYDFTRLVDGHGNAVNFQRVLAGVWASTFFAGRVGLTDEDYEKWGAAGWFPFIGLSQHLIKRMRLHAASGGSLDDLLPDIVAEVRRNLARLRERVAKNGLFEGHRTVISTGLNHFDCREYPAAIHILYARIEGLLRMQHRRLMPTPQWRGQKALAASIVADPNHVWHEWSLLVPHHFKRFLEAFYFADFDEAAPPAISRHSVAHGVAPEGGLNESSATRAVLIVEQLAILC